MIVKYLIAWIPMVLLAIVNGVVRETTYGTAMPELRAHQLSTLTGIALFGLYIWIVTGWWRPASPGQALGLGAMWLVLTVAFEFLFGHYVAGHPWSRLLQDYDLLEGRLWPLILAWVALAPWLFERIRTRRR
jgi:hypothetical protein